MQRPTDPFPEGPVQNFSVPVGPQPWYIFTKTEQIANDLQMQNALQNETPVLYLVVSKYSFCGFRQLLYATSLEKTGIFLYKGSSVKSVKPAILPQAVLP
ncbi:MAG: hypothetical protein R2932_43725 [Caldilineaceae bacterium]